jgi:hypothetical protein
MIAGSRRVMVQVEPINIDRHDVRQTNKRQP